MPTQLAFDQLNILGQSSAAISPTSSASYKRRSIPYREYFGDMDLTEEQIEKRIQTAENIEDSMLFLFALISTMSAYSYMDLQYIYQQAESRYLEAISTNNPQDEYISQYASEFARETVDTTVEHIDDPYYLSSDRAMYIAENEANTSLNHTEYMQAIEDGYTRKRWVDIRDKRERETHLEVGGTEIPIDELFMVGDSFMLYPKDTTYGAGAEEIIGCRCTIKYIK